MKIKLLVSILVVCLFMLCYPFCIAIIIRKQGILYGNFSKVTKGIYLTDALLNEIQNTNVEMCLAACINHLKCKSISYQENEQKCALFNDVLGNVTENIEKEGWTHMQTEGGLKNGPTCDKLSPCKKGQYEYCEDLCEDLEYKCVCKAGFNGTLCQDGYGLTAIVPGKSCKDIKEKSVSAKDGYYWVSLPNPINVYCDMTTYGGGWLMIGFANILNTTEGGSYGVQNSGVADITKLNSVKSGKFLLTTNGLADLQNKMGFEQIRIYCRKPSINRTFHIVTAPNINGKAVIDYLSNKTDEQPHWCESAVVVPDDTSLLSKSCSSWESGKWSTSSSFADRLYDHAIYIPNKYHVFLTSGRQECDDHDIVNDNRVGIWKFFVR